MNITLGKYQIKFLKNSNKLYYNSAFYGTLNYDGFTIEINGENGNYNGVFAKMFMNYIFKNTSVEKATYLNQTISKKDFYFVKNYDILLFDIDDTILSFEKAERNSLTPVLKKYGVQPTEELLALYASVNAKYWKKVEKGEITREECLVLRFVEYLPLIGLDSNFADEVEDLYRFYLNQSAYVILNAKKVVKELSKTHDVYAITNGVKRTQELRCKKAHVDVLFKKFYISEAIGYNKPSKEFLAYVRNDIVDFDLKKVLIIGDSLSSDIALGYNNNIDTCWFNPRFKVNDTTIKPTYQINSIEELLY